MDDSKKKTMILVAAPPACGKTTVSDRICRKLGHVAYFDKDDYSGLIDLVFDLTGNNRDMDGTFYREHVKAVQYGTMFHMAKTALRYEDIVLLNAPFPEEVRHPEILKCLREELKTRETLLYVVWVLASPEQCHERMLARNAARDQEKLADWETFVKNTDFSVPEDLVKQEAVDALLVVDSTDAEKYEKTIEEAVSKINQENGPN